MISGRKCQFIVPEENLLLPKFLGHRGILVILPAMMVKDYIDPCELGALSLCLTRADPLLASLFNNSSKLRHETSSEAIPGLVVGSNVFASLFLGSCSTFWANSLRDKLLLPSFLESLTPIYISSMNETWWLKSSWKEAERELVVT